MFQKLYDRRGNLGEIIEQCALSELLERDNRKLSGGQRQRLLLAIALVNEPRIVFLDEPTTGLDPQARRNFWELVKRIRETGTTIILTTHYMDEAQILCDDIAIMDGGKIIAQGNPDALLRERYRNVIIELPIDDVGSSLTGLDHRLMETRGIVEIETDDVNSSLAELSNRRTPLQHLRIRQPNLEDLFIDLTGHSLRA